MYEAYVAVNKVDGEVDLTVTIKARTLAELSQRIVAHIALFDDTTTKTIAAERSPIKAGGWAPRPIKDNPQA